MADAIVELTGLSHIGIRVHELERALAFYELLGFRLTAGPFEKEPVAILQHPSGLELNLIINATDEAAPNVLMDIEEKHPGYTHVALSVTDVEASVRALEQAGCPLSGGLVEFPNGSRAAFVRDPDRNVVELNQSAK